VDLAPTLMGWIRDRNAAALATPSAPVIVPTVVFLQNAFGTDISAAPATPAAEIVAPLTARGAAKELEQYRAARQRLQALLADPVPCPQGSTGENCPMTTASGIPPFVLVAPATEPSVTAPLGWTLSQASIDELTHAVDKQASPGCGGQRRRGQTLTARTPCR
jgi:hypothetical protein